MFSPYNGMLYELNQTNADLFKNGNLDPVKINLHPSSKDYYSLTDKFHQQSKKKSFRSQSRNLRLCSNLSGKFNSSVAEQANSIMSRDR